MLSQLKIKEFAAQSNISAVTNRECPLVKAHCKTWNRAPCPLRYTTCSLHTTFNYTRARCRCNCQSTAVRGGCRCTCHIATNSTLRLVARSIVDGDDHDGETDQYKHICLLFGVCGAGATQLTQYGVCFDGVGRCSADLWTSRAKTINLYCICGQQRRHWSRLGPERAGAEHLGEISRPSERTTQQYDSVDRCMM